jgi:hypothetical protein
LQNFAANVTQAPENLGKINVQVKKPDDSIEAGAQVQQMINAECVDDYPGKINYFSVCEKVSKIPLCKHSSFLLIKLKLIYCSL